MALHRWLRRLLPMLLLALALASPAQAAPPAGEHALIVALIQRVETMTAMTFLRNGKPHTAAEAAQHMRAKYAHFEERVATAEDFIDLCASRSEVTGRPYLVKIGEAAPVEASAFLNDELRALRKSAAP